MSGPGASACSGSFCARSEAESVTTLPAVETRVKIQSLAGSCGIIRARGIPSDEDEADPCFDPLASATNDDRAPSASRVPEAMASSVASIDRAALIVRDARASAASCPAFLAIACAARFASSVLR